MPPGAAEFDVSDPKLYQDDAWRPYFERLRREAPIHYVPDSPYGPYWAVSKYKDIMHCEVHHEVFSNEIGGIQIEDQPKDLQRPSFIRMDPPRHDDQRKVASPIVAPGQSGEHGTADPRAHPASCWTRCRVARRSTGCRTSRSS